MVIKLLRYRLHHDRRAVLILCLSPVCLGFSIRIGLIAISGMHIFLFGIVLLAAFLSLRFFQTQYGGDGHFFRTQPFGLRSVLGSFLLEILTLSFLLAASTLLGVIIENGFMGQMVASNGLGAIILLIASTISLCYSLTFVLCISITATRIPLLGGRHLGRTVIVVLIVFLMSDIVRRILNSLVPYHVIMTQVGITLSRSPVPDSRQGSFAYSLSGLPFLFLSGVTFMGITIRYIRKYLITGDRNTGIVDKP